MIRARGGLTLTAQTNGSRIGSSVSGDALFDDSPSLDEIETREALSARTRNHRVCRRSDGDERAILVRVRPKSGSIRLFIVLGGSRHSCSPETLIAHLKTNGQTWCPFIEGRSGFSLPAIGLGTYSLDGN